MLTNNIKSFIIYQQKGGKHMYERLKKLRKTLNLTQQQFADRIGSKRNTVAKYETQANTPSTAVISLICREFHVNEEWLRHGTGEMFLPKSRENEIEKAIRNLFTEETDTFKSRFIAMLARLSSSDWERLEAEARRLLDLRQEETSDSLENSVDNVHKIVHNPEETSEELDIDKYTVEELEEEYKKMLHSASKTNFTASHTTKDADKIEKENKII